MLRDAPNCRECLADLSGPFPIRKAGPSKVGGRRRFVAASNQSHRRLLFAES